MKKKSGPGGLALWLKLEKWGVALLALAAALFAAACLWLRPEAADPAPKADYVEYEKAVVTAVLSDNTASDPASDGGWRGEQTLTVEVKSGRYAGQTMLVYN